MKDKNENVITEAIEKNEKVQTKEMDSNVKQNQKDDQDKKGKEEQVTNDKEKAQTQKQSKSKEDAETKELSLKIKSNEIHQEKNKTKVIEKNQNKIIDSNPHSPNSNENGQTNNNNETIKKIIQINKNNQIKPNQSKNEQLELNTNDFTQTNANEENESIESKESSKDNCINENTHSEIDKDDSGCTNSMDNQCIDKESNENAKCKNKLRKIMQKFKSNQTKKFVKLSPTSKTSPNTNKVEVNNEIIKEYQLNDDKEFDNDKDTLNTDTEPQQRAE